MERGKEDESKMRMKGGRREEDENERGRGR